MKLLPASIAVLTTTTLALPLCPQYYSTTVNSHDGVVNTKSKLQNNFWNRIWKFPSNTRYGKKPSYGSVYWDRVEVDRNSSGHELSLDISNPELVPFSFLSLLT